MTDYRWNKKLNTVSIWDHSIFPEEYVEKTDREIVARPDLIRTQNALAALFRVVNELVELEEARGGKTPEELLEIKRKVGM